MPASRRFLDRVRYFNKRTFNPWILKSAGTARSPFAMVGHGGRRSGTAYATPAIGRRVRDGFAFALTYEPQVDWYRKFLASGTGTLRWRGKTYKLEQPERMRAEVGLQAFPAPLMWVLKLNRLRDPFRMSLSQPGPGSR